MRWCDKWLGRPFGVLIWLISPLLHRNKQVLPGQLIPDVRRIVVIKVFGMGSLLLATPAFRALRKTYPQASFELITSSTHIPFVQTLQVFDRFHGLSLTGILPFLGGLIKLLIAPRPDISINLEYYTWFTIALQTLQRARIRVGFAERQWLRLHLLDLPVYFNHHHHITRIFGAVAAELGAPVTSYQLSAITIQPTHIVKVKKTLNRMGHDPDHPLISVHIGASPLCRLRQWPLDRFYSLIQLLINKTDARIALVGGPDEKEEADEFFARFEAVERLINLVGKLSIPETIATLQLSSLLITNDSGLLHWAIAVNTATVSFFGPETPDLYGPENRERHVVFYSGRYCSPCLTTTYAKVSDCSNNLCLQDIRVPEVFDAVINRLNYGRAHASNK